MPKLGAEIYLLAMQLGLFLIFIGLISLVFSRKKVVLLKTATEKIIRKNAGWNKWNKLMFSLSANSLFKLFTLKPESDEYIRLEKKIAKAGGCNGLIPEILQVYRIGLPLAFLTGLMAFWFTVIAINTVLGRGIQALTSTQFAGVAIMMIVFAMLYFIPEQIINYITRKRQNKLHKELYNIGPFTVSMLSSQAYGTYEIIQTLSDTTIVLRPYFKTCLNEYYLHPKQAIQNMAERVADDNFQVICNGLKQIIEMDKQHTALFMQQHLDEINRMRALQREARIKKKPLLYVLLLVFPMASIVIIWFYPWFVQAMEVLGGIL